MEQFRDRAIEAIILGVLITIALLVGTPCMGRALATMKPEPTLQALKQP
jgi:hypothetical protein